QGALLSRVSSITWTLLVRGLLVRSVARRLRLVGGCGRGSLLVVRRGRLRVSFVPRGGNGRRFLGGRRFGRLRRVRGRTFPTGGGGLLLGFHEYRGFGGRRVDPLDA